MNIRPAGYYDDFSDEEGSECESGFSETSADANEASPPPAVTLQKAIQQGALDEVELLVAELADYESFVLENGLKPLVYAASVGNPQIVDWLLRYDAERGIAADAYASYTPLMAACSGFTDDYNEEQHDGRLECVRLLLAASHDPTFRDRYGETVLMRACKSAPVAVVEMLLQQDGIKLDEADNDGWTPLFYATHRGDMELVQYLLALGADPVKVDKRNRCPYMIAMEKGFSELADLLTPKSERPTDEFSLPATSSCIFDEEDVRYCAEVLELVAASSANMKRNLPIFGDTHLALRDFLLLKSEEELKKLGILFSGHRKKILVRIKQFHLGGWLPESFGLTQNNECGHLMMLLNFVATLHRQLYVLQTSLVYVKDDISKLSAEDGASVAEMLKSSKSELLGLNNRLAALKCRLVTINAESHPYLTAEEILD